MNIKKFLEEIEKNERILKTRFSTRLINEVGEIYERYGYAMAKAFLLSKKEDKKFRFEAQTLLYILNIVNDMKVPPSVGGFLIRKIKDLKGEKL